MLMQVFGTRATEMIHQDGGVCRPIIMIAWRSCQMPMQPPTKAMSSSRRPTGNARTWFSEPGGIERTPSFAGRRHNSSDRLPQCNHDSPRVGFPPKADVGLRTALSSIAKFVSAIPQHRTVHALHGPLLAELLIIARHGRLGRAVRYSVGEGEPNTHWFFGLPLLLRHRGRTQ
jgi:hypothetical protein